MALIELDLDAPPAHPPSRPPARYFRYVAALACAFLVLALGGAAPTASVLWKWAGLVSLAGPSTSDQLIGGLLYALDSGAGGHTVTAWSMDPVRKLWSVSTPPGTVVQDGAALVRSGKYTLLQTATGTTVIDPRTGRIHWTSPAPLIADNGDVGILQHIEFAPGTVYDESSGDPGPLYFSEDGVPHNQAPERTVLHGLDLGTGRELWTVSEPGSVYVVPSVDDTAGFVLVAANRLAVLAADTGAVIREHALPRFAGDDVSYPEIVGGLLLLRHDVSDTGAATATAFGLDTLTQRWQMTEPTQAGGGSGACLGLLCRPERERLAVLDPATGRPRWYGPRNATLLARGGETLELSGTSTPLSVRDTRTGRVDVDLSAWRTIADTADDGPIVVFRAQPPEGRAGFGVLMPGARRVQSLGLSRDRVERCSADLKHVACRTLSGVEVWSYQG